MFYCIVSGNKDFNDYGKLKRTMDDVLKDIQGAICIITGDDKGADELAARYAEDTGCKLSVYYADWTTYHRDAGKRRSEYMYSFAEKQDEKAAVLFGDVDGATALKITLGKEHGIPTKRVN